jgi:hypothetical protein
MKPEIWIDDNILFFEINLDAMVTKRFKIMQK